MLTAVLLKVIQPPRAIYAAPDFLARLYKAGLLYGVIDYAVFVFRHIDYIGVAQLARIVWLAAACGIKSRLIKRDPVSRIGWLDIDHPREKIQ